MGRVSVDLYPEQIGVTLAEVETFAKSLGGSATNVTVAASRLGHPSAVITKVGDDGFGPYVRKALEEFGVDARWVATIHPILMEDRPAERLLVVEVVTPQGHWSSYPPHKHDEDNRPHETYLEETYYHKIQPPQGFAVQRVYTEDRSLDETLTVQDDDDTVLVPRGYHAVSAPPGYDLYYLNVMAGPVREWKVKNDPDHEWLLE